MSRYYLTNQINWEFFQEVSQSILPRSPVFYQITSQFSQTYPRLKVNMPVKNMNVGVSLVRSENLAKSIYVGAWSRWEIGS